MTTLRLIGPPRELHPNARVHWTCRARVTKTYRTYAASVARTANLVPCQEELLVRLIFWPPDRQHRDLDNLQARMKAGLDGIAAALKTNDRTFRPASEWGQVDPAGQGDVMVELEPWARVS